MTDTATTVEPTEQLTQAGVSIWLDDINRENFANGKLQNLINGKHVVGVTTNPTIFATALAKGDAYDAQLRELREGGKDEPEAVFEITTRDVRDACDLFMDVYEQTRGYDGRVSIEVSPENAHDTQATIAEAKKLWAAVDRPNVMIKIPATEAGVPAISAVIAEGISVNVTLIFGLERYRQVIEAYLEGLGQALAAGRDIAQIHSVASFFISRVDAEVNRRLLEHGADENLLNQTAVANARLAYQVFQKAFQADRGREMLDRGANYQRPLWASTGTKTDDIPDTYYVTELIAPQTVNTMPEKTLMAVADHGQITGDSVTYRYGAAEHVLEQVRDAGVDIEDVAHTLEAEGVQKFIDSWSELGETVRKQLAV